MEQIDLLLFLGVPKSITIWQYTVVELNRFDGWTIQPLCVVDYNPTLLPNAAKHQEDVCMKALRRAGHPLLNKNCAVDANERRRLANKRWRDNHPGYMAQKSREARQRRRLALETEGDAN